MRWNTIKAYKHSTAFHRTEGDDAVKWDEASETFHPEHTAGVWGHKVHRRGFHSELSARHEAAIRRADVYCDSDTAWVRVCVFSVSILQTSIENALETITQKESSKRRSWQRNLMVKTYTVERGFEKKLRRWYYPRWKNCFVSYKKARSWLGI